MSELDRLKERLDRAEKLLSKCQKHNRLMKDIIIKKYGRLEYWDLYNKTLEVEDND